MFRATKKGLCRPNEKKGARLIRTGRLSFGLCVRCQLISFAVAEDAPLRMTPSNSRASHLNCRLAHGWAGGFAALAASILAFSCACWSGVSTSFNLAMVPA